jgi:hypothetical protein
MHDRANPPAPVASVGGLVLAPDVLAAVIRARANDSRASQAHRRGGCPDKRHPVPMSWRPWRGRTALKERGTI